MLIMFIIHSKYFPWSDWLKAHAQFPITSYWWPNLEEFCHQSTDDVKRAASLQVSTPLTEKNWGRGWVVLAVKAEMADISLVGCFISYYGIHEGVGSGGRGNGTPCKGILNKTSFSNYWPFFIQKLWKLKYRIRQTRLTGKLCCENISDYGNRQRLS